MGTKRRRNHGRPVAVGDLAHRAVDRIVPDDRLRLCRIQIAWPEITAGRLGEVAWPSRVYGKTLMIAVADNQWLHELSYLRADLLARVQHHCPRCNIVEAKLRVGEIPPAPPIPETIPDPPRAPALSDEPARETLDALRSVDDPDLRQIVANARLALSGRLRR